MLSLLLLTTVGVNAHLPPADSMDLAQALHTSWIRIDFNWNIAEPVQGQYDWSLFDAVADGARARGLHVYASVGYGPAWASVSNDRRGDGPGNDVPDATAYRTFVAAAAARYADGRIEAWGPWNEPNLADFFEGTRDEWIANVFGPGIDGIRQGCPNCKVGGPELATIGSAYADYLQAALAARGPQLDMVTWHIYAGFQQQDAGAGTTSDSFFNKLDMHRLIQIGGTTIYEGPLSVREVLVAQGYPNLPVWITETGKQAAVGDTTALETQRQYVQLVLDAQDQRPWWQNTFFYELTEEHPNGMWPDIHWGLALRTDTGFTHKPAYDYLQARLAAPPPDGGAGSGGAGGSGGTPGSGGAGGSSGSGGSGGSGGSSGSGGSTGTGGSAGNPASGQSSGGCSMITSAPAFPLALLVSVFLLRHRRR